MARDNGLGAKGQEGWRRDQRGRNEMGLNGRGWLHQDEVGRNVLDRLQREGGR